MLQHTHLKLLKHIEQNPNASQRDLAKAVGVSVGKVNYCVKALVEKGFVKAGNFGRSDHKLGYLYLLTPSGIEAKANLTVNFLKRKIAEHEQLLGEIEQLKQDTRNTK
jgi:EPS-associated MarR family transcriptional regulator